MTKLLAIIAVALVLPASAAAQTTVSTPGPWQEWVATARVPTPPVTLEVVVGENCLGGLGCTEGDLIELSPLAADNRGVFLHELGHVFDLTVLTPGERERFAAILGPQRRSMPWWSGEDGWSMGEWFAEAYRQCARLPKVDPHWGYTVDSGLLVGWRLRRECGLIRYAGGVR
jgi:hypothetical protein